MTYYNGLPFINSIRKLLHGRFSEKNEELYKFFSQVLIVSDRVSKKDACAIEHYISKETLDNMIKFIKFIDTCPEGYPSWLKSFNYYVEHGRRPKSCPKKET